MSNKKHGGNLLIPDTEKPKKKIIIVHKQRLIDGDVYDDGQTEIETDKTISINQIWQMSKDGKWNKALHLQIGNFLEKDFKEYILFDDTIYIE